MASKQLKNRKTPIATPDLALARYKLMDDTIRRGGAQIDELESALGMYMVGFHFGWKVLYMVHSKRTIRKYEEILGIKVIEAFDEVGPDAHRTNAFKIINAASNFWKAVSGEDKPLGLIDKRALVDKDA